MAIQNLQLAEIPKPADSSPIFINYITHITLQLYYRV